MMDPQEAVTRDVSAALSSLPKPAPAEEGQGQRRPAVAGLQRRTANSVFDLKSLASIAVIVVFVITFVVQAFRVPSESMENTLLTGDFLLADKLHFAAPGGIWSSIMPYREIQRGDIVVFRYPMEPSVYFVKRIVGLPGDHIHMRDRVVFINGKPLQEGYVVHRLSRHDFYRDNFPHGEDPRDMDCPWCRELPRFVREGELVVPPRQYFLLGDNRDQSSDSRYWGFVPRDNVLGRPLVIYLSVRGWRDQAGATNDKLFGSGQALAHFLHLARWERIFRIVR